MPVQLSAFPVQYEQNPLKQIITTGEKFEAMIRWLKSRKRIVVDYETSGIAWFQHAAYCGVGFAGWDESGRVWNAYVPVRHHTAMPQLSEELIAPAIKDLLADPAIEKVGHNIKFEDHFSRKEGWRIVGPRYDTMIAARLYNDNAPLKLEKRAELDLGITDAMAWNHALTVEVAKLARANGMKIEEYRWRYGYSEVDPVLCGIYCCTDTDHTAKLRDHYEAWGVSRHYPRIWPTEMRLTEVLCGMEQAGMRVDVPYLQLVRERARAARDRLQDRIHQLMGGYKFNIGSDDDLRSTLYHVLGLRWEKRTKGNQLAVDREVLEGFADSIEVCKLILAWRDADKIDTTYTTSIIGLLDANHFVHGNLKSVGTNTGRLSCEDPNYQNLPTDDDARSLEATGKKIEDGGQDPWSIRRGFPVRDKDWVRVFLDYSQVELRVLAYYSRDPILVDTYLTGGDVHERTAREIGAKLGIEAIPRRIAKVINFGLSYCMSEKGVAANTKITVEEAAVFLQAFFQRYAGISTFRQELWAKARREGCQWSNIFGRTRRLPDLTSEVFWKRKRAERQMIGSAIQGTAAELTKESLVRLADCFAAEKIPALLVNTVHDEIQIDCPRECLALVVKRSKQLMEAFPEFQPIPIIADPAVTDRTWADKQDYEESANGNQPA